MVRPKKKTSSSLYSYSAKRSLRQEEIAAYRRIVLATVMVIALITGGYFLGIPLLASLGGGPGNTPPNTQLGSVDNIPPAPPNINSLPNEVRTRTVEISGTAESGTTVTVEINQAKAFDALVDKDGYFSGEAALDGGQNTIRAIAKDAAGNQSRSSREITIVYDATPPTLALLQELPSQTTTAAIEIVGRTEPRAKVTINDRVAVVNGEGSFTSNLRLTAGENKITIIAQDDAGNTRKLERTVTYNAQEASASAQPN